MLSRAASIVSRKSASAVSECASASSRLLSSSSGKFRPRRRPGKNYRAAAASAMKKPHRKQQARGVKDPNDVSTPPRPTIDFSNIKITDVEDDNDDDTTLLEFGNLAGGALKMLRRELEQGEMDLETKLKMMDYFTSAPGSTEDLVGERRILALETPDAQERLALMAEIDRLVEKERLDNMELPATEPITMEDLEKEQSSGSTQIPHNQLAHGDWYV